jgi:protein-tyrosine-phosphatase
MIARVGAAMKMGFLVLVLGVWVSTSFASGADWQQWKEEEHAFQVNSAILSAQGKKEAATFRLNSLISERERIHEMFLKKSITETRLKEAELAVALEQSEIKEQTSKVRELEEKRALEENSKKCQAGISSACDQASQSYKEMLRARVLLAEAEVEKAKAHLDFESFQNSGLQELVAKQVIDPAIGPESTARLNASRREYEASLAKWKLAKEAISF